MYDRISVRLFMLVVTGCWTAYINVATAEIPGNQPTPNNGHGPGLAWPQHSAQLTGELLEKLTFHDEVYRGSIAASGSVRRPPSSLDRRQVVVPMSWRFTRELGRVALIESAIGDPEILWEERPDDQQPGQSGPRTYDEDNNMYVPVRTKNALSFEDDRSAKYSVSTVFKISPTGDIAGRTENHLYDYYGPDDNALVVSIRSLEWVIGRGFSDCLKEITGVEELDNGWLKLVGPGSPFGPGTGSGAWHLVVDPSSHYIVRSAEYFRESSSSPYIAISNDNVVQDGPLYYPRNGECRIRRPESVYYSIEYVRPEMDATIFSEAKKLTNESDRQRSVTIDNRVNPPDIKVRVNDIYSEETPTKRRWGFWFFVSLAMVVVGLSVIAIGFLRKSK